MTELERAIVATMARARAEGLEPASIYLTPGDAAQLQTLGHGRTIGGLPVRQRSGKGSSIVYCRHGIGRHVSLRASRLSA